MSFHVRCLQVAQLKVLEFVGDLFLCIAVSISSFWFFNLQSVFTSKPKDHHIKPHVWVWRYNLEAPTKSRRKQIKPVWQVFSSYKQQRCYSRANRVMLVCHASGRCAHLVRSVLYPSSRVINPFLEGLLFRFVVYFYSFLIFWPGGRGGGTSGNSRWGCAARPVLQTLTLFQTKKCHFSQPFSDLATKIHIHSQIIPLRN